MANPWIITFLIIAFISIVGNAISVIQLIQLGSLNAVTSKLILFLHVSGMIHSIGQLPLLYYQNTGLCEFMGFVHFYGGLVNAVTLVFLSTAYVNFLLEKPERNLLIQKYGGYITFLFPSITLLPFTTNAYDASGIWCTLPVANETSNIWSLAVSYVWVTLALLYSSGILIYVIYHSWHEKIITRTLFSAAGIYIIVTWIGLIPGFIPRIIQFFTPINTSDAAQFFLRAPSNLASIAYCLCFIANYETFSEYEKHFSRSNQSGDQEITFAELEKALNERHHSTNTDHDRNSGNGSGLHRRPSNVSVGSINDDLVSSYTANGRRNSSTNNPVKDYLTQLRRQYSVEKRTISIDNPVNSNSNINNNNNRATGKPTGGVRISQASNQSSHSTGSSSVKHQSDIENPLLTDDLVGRASNARRTFGSSLAESESLGSGL